jgi:hypothetical protein
MFTSSAARQLEDYQKYHTISPKKRKKIEEEACITVGMSTKWSTDN